jgi:amino acid adenylation domain-containing protein
MSAAQRRLWFLEKLSPGTATYNIALAFDVDGALRPGALHAAASGVVAGHQVLRSTFREIDGVPHCLPLNRPDVDFAVIRLPDTAGDDLGTVLTREASTPFDLARGPLVRVRVVATDAGRTALLICLHHLIADAGSLEPFFTELATAYAAVLDGDCPPAGDAPPRDHLEYADYVAWQGERLACGAPARDRRWWRETLRGAQPVLPLPDGSARPPVRAGRGVERGLRLPTEVAWSCRALARAEGATPFMVLLSVTAALLGRLTGQDDVLIGVPMAGRTHPDLDRAIGLFANTLPVRLRADSRSSLRSLLHHTRDAALGALAHQEVPLDWIVGDLAPARSPSHTPVFQVIADLQHAVRPRLAGVRLRPRAIDTGTAKFDLAWSFRDDEGQLEIRLTADRDLFGPASADRLLSHFHTLFERALADPDRPVDRLDLLTADEHRQLRRWNATASARPAPPHTLPGLVDRRAGAHPARPAVRFAGRDLAYGELWSAVRGFADELRGHGVGAETVAGVSTEPSPHTVVALLAVLAAGGAFLPLDPGHPPARLRYLLDEARARLIAAPPGAAGAFRGLSLPVLTPDLTRAPAGHQPARTAGIPDNALAYVMYTSGSTGRPKGVMVAHRAITNRIRWMLAAHHLGPGDRVLLKTPLTFDVALGELFAALASGALLVVAESGAHRDPEALAELVRRESITVAHFVPSLLDPFLDALERQDALSGVRLRRVFCSGEALSPRLARRAARLLPEAELHNLYGPTEAAVEVSGWHWGPGDGPRDASSVPIGHPMAGCALHVLDPRLCPVPVGVAGELYIGGVQVGRGYLAAPAGTALAFLPDPFSDRPGSRMYRTGDRAVRRADGAVEFLGRTDRQVKVRGQRVELGEIEAALRSCAGLRNAAVSVVERGELDRRIVAYVVRDSSALPVDVRGYLAARLPPIMVPSHVVVCDELPLTSSGKVDHAALPGVPGAARAGADRPIGAEQAVAAVLADVLGVAELGRQDDFFDLGGHSLLAVEALGRLRGQLGLDLPLRAFLEAPSVAGTAAAARARRPAAPRPVPAAAASGPVRPAPLLVTGATGMAGAFVVAELHRRGHRLRMLVRGTSDAPVDVSADDELVLGDLADPASLRSAAAGAAGIVHLACTFGDWQTDVAATEQLAACWGDGPLVLVSSTDVYARDAPGPMGEESALDETSSHYAKGKVRCERLVLATAAARRRDDVSILRPPYVWGPHPYCRWQLRIGAGHAFYRAVRDGTPIVLPAAENALPGTGLSWVAARDLAHLVAECLERPAGGPVNAVGGRLGWAEFYTELGRLTGLAPRIGTDGAASDEFHARVRWYSTSRLERQLGFTSHRDWREVLAQAVTGSAMADPEPAAAPAP